MKSNMELEMFIQMDEKVLWESSTLPFFYLITDAQKCWAAKGAGWLSGGLLMLLCVLVICSHPNHLVWASHLLQLDKNDTAIDLDH